MQNQDETIKTNPEPSNDGPQDQTDSLAETMPVSIPADPQPGNSPKKKGRWGRKISLAILIFIVVVILGGAAGYGFAIQDRIQREEALKSTAIYDQFLLGLVNMERGEYEIARQRFEYILQINPNHTEAAALLTEALLHLGENSVLPTQRPSATPVPTADTRAQEDIFNSALTLRDNQDWDALISTLDGLRLADPNYRSIEVDGLYYIAYRNRGLRRIQLEGNLEGGIFDITRAEAFGPLDVEARNYRQWSEDYLTGVSFWGVDWYQVMTYFNQLSVVAPYLSDTSYLTSLDRLATAQYELYSQNLVTAGYRITQGKYCEAYDLLFEASLYIVLNDHQLANMETARNQCLGIPPTEAPQTTTEP